MYVEKAPSLPDNSDLQPQTPTPHMSSNFGAHVYQKHLLTYKRPQGVRLLGVGSGLGLCFYQVPQVVLTWAKV